MLEFLNSTPARMVIGVAVTAMLSIAGYYVVRKFRDRINEDGVTANELLANFREMRQQGDIDEAEYRTIRTALGPKLQQELKTNEEEG
jgi:uncharacterized membrane protein